MRTDLPTGTVTFLFTDVEGSTKLLHELGAEAYATALAEHRRVIREMCGREGGVEVDTQGDAFFVAFPTATGAVAAASALTEVLAAGRVQVRVGIHTGTPLVTDEGYVGDDVHLAARLADSGHGGQVVLSRATAALLKQSLVDLGEQRFKDVDGPVGVFQVGDRSFPPLRTISNTNLPRPASSFLGREQELAAVLERFANGARLVTLTGPGGSGKTRLAIEAAESLIPGYHAGVFWVGLSALRDPMLVTETIARAVGAKNGLTDHIGERDMLLLLDNLEQVIDAAPELTLILERCPKLALLVTSRELLRIAGEVEYAVPPLAEPEAVALYCERAQADTTDDVAALCARLDNLPLAIELAAARGRVLPPVEVLERLSDRLDLLRGGRDADPRQRTLRATIEWSHELLSPEEQQLFARLAVFRGGCTLDAAETVCEANLDMLLSLVEKSLVRFANGRYWMLETIREYAAERLRELEDVSVLRERHVDYFLELAHRAEPELEAAEQAAWLDRLEDELDNIRAALDLAQDSGRSEEALAAALALRRLWDMRVPSHEAQRRFEGLLAVEQPLELRALALRDLAQVAIFRGDHERAAQIAEERLELYRALDDDVGIHRTLQGLAVIAIERGDLERARALISPVVAWARDVSEYELTYPLDTLAEIAFREGEYEESLTVSQEALAIYERLGDDMGVAGACGGIGTTYLYQGRLDDARAFLSRSLTIWRGLGDRRVLGWLFALAALVAVMRGDARRAALLLGKSDDVMKEIGERRPSWPGGPDDRATRAVSEALGEDEFQAARSEGAALPFDEAVELALASID
jgi:predicted ATPase